MPPLQPLELRFQAVWCGSEGTGRLSALLILLQRQESPAELWSTVMSLKRHWKIYWSTYIRALTVLSAQ